MKSKWAMLIVEDDPTIHDSMHKTLESLNQGQFTIIYHKNRQNAEAEINRQLFIAASLDQRIPFNQNGDNSVHTKHGKELAYLFSATNPLSYKIVYTAYPEQTLQQEVLQKGFKYYSKNELTNAEWARNLMENTQNYIKTTIQTEGKNQLIAPLSKVIDDSKRFFPLAIRLLAMGYFAFIKKETSSLAWDNLTEVLESVRISLSHLEDTFIAREWKKIWNDDFIEDCETSQAEPWFYAMMIQRLSIFTIHPILYGFKPRLYNYKPVIDAKRMVNTPSPKNVTIDTFDRIPKSDEIAMCFEEEKKTFFISLNDVIPPCDKHLFFLS